MRSAASRLELVMGLLFGGFLCRCRRLVFKETDDGKFERVLKHRKDCRGKKEIARLIAME